MFVGSLLLLLALFTASAFLLGEMKWRGLRTVLRDKMEAARLPAAPQVYDPREIQGLPAPVQRYFQAALTEGQPMVEAVDVKHEGTFNVSETGKWWRPFKSTQRVVTRRPGFDWAGSIDLLGGIPMKVHDAYVAGEGLLSVYFTGFIPVVKQQGTPQLAHGELMRFLAEAAWYPTALLPSQGVRWKAIDDRSAEATFQNGETTVTLLFNFGDDGLVETVASEGRERTIGDRSEITPWQGRFWNYETWNGMQVPMEGEVAWILPHGPRPYWRGKIHGITYELAQ